jgi:hypothetical protein
MEGQGGGEAQGVTEPQKIRCYAKLMPRATDLAFSCEPAGPAGHALFEGPDEDEVAAVVDAADGPFQVAVRKDAF